MYLFNKNLYKEVVVIAEIGVNHEGSLSKAIEMVGLAAATGADAVKFQTYDPWHYASTSDMDRFERVSQFGLSQEDFTLLARESERLGIGFFSTPLEETSVEFVDSLSSVIKIASPDMNFEPTIRGAAATGKALIISTGLGTPEEIDQTLGWVQDEIGSAELRDRVVLLHCVSAYPTPLEDINLLSIPYLADRYPVHVGFSDHTIGLQAARAAIALGATVVEKHFTDSNVGREFRDHELSANPEQMKELVEDARAIKGALGTLGKGRSASEIGNLIPLRKGVVAARDLAEGTILTSDDLMFARPSTQISADRIDEVVGKRLKIALKKGNLIPSNTLDD